MAAKWKKSEREEMKEWQDASVEDLGKTEKRKSSNTYKPVICHHCNFVIGMIDEMQIQVRCPSCDKVIYHLGQKC